MLSAIFDLLANLDGFRIQTLPAVIGRSKDATIQIPDRFVSRLQCRIELIDDELVLTDLESHHGTFVNETKITRAVICPGDVIRIGARSYHFNYVNGVLLFRIAHSIPANQCDAASDATSEATLC